MFLRLSGQRERKEGRTERDLSIWYMVNKEVVCVCVNNNNNNNNNRLALEVVVLVKFLCGDVRWWMQHSVVQERSEGGG